MHEGAVGPVRVDGVVKAAAVLAGLAIAAYTVFHVARMLDARAPAAPPCAHPTWTQPDSPAGYPVITWSCPRLPA